MCIVRIANNINRNVYMHLNTRIFPTTGDARVLLFMFIRLELGGMVQDVYFSLHTVIYIWPLSIRQQLTIQMAGGPIVAQDSMLAVLIFSY